MQQYFLWKQLPLFLLGMFWSSLMYGQSSLVSIQTVDTDCGMTTGSIQLTPQLSGSYTYQWSTGATSSSISGLAIGDYTCTITQGSTTEVVKVPVCRPWELEPFVTGSTTVSIIGNTATINPNLAYTNLADQRTHVYDKTPIDIETQTGSIFAKFTKTHANFPNQISNSDTSAPPKFYLELFKSKDLSKPIMIPLFVHEADLKVVTGGWTPHRVFIEKGVRKLEGTDYTGVDYTDGDEFEIRFLGNHQIEVYLRGVLITSQTLAQRTTNEYIAAVGFKDMDHLDRWVAYDLRSTFCSSMPVVKPMVTHSQKYGATGEIDLLPITPSYMNTTYSYTWSTGATNASIQNLAKGTYTVTISNTTGETKVLTTQVYDKLGMQAASDVGIVKIVENSVTCDPAIPMQSISDYRTHAYDPTVPINVQTGGGSIRFRFSAEHPNFPNQHSNTDDYNAALVVRLQEAVDPLPVPTFFLDYPFQMTFYTDGRVSTSGRSTTWAGPYQYFTHVGYPKGGYDVELRFEGNRVIAVYMNDVYIGNRTVPGTIEEYYFMVGFSDDASRQRRIAYDLLTSFESESLVSIQTVDTDCGMNTGSIQLTPQLSGSYTYQWSTGATSSSISGLAIGDYTCTITQGSTTEVIQASIYRPWELERFISGDTTVSIIGNTATINPNLVPSAEPFYDQRTHVYDKTPIDVETQTGSIFVKFGETHANYPNQWSNPDSTAPPVFYVELFPITDIGNNFLSAFWASESNFALLIGGRLPEKIFAMRGTDIHDGNYTGYDYTSGEELEFRFLGNHQLEVYLGTTLIYSTTIPQLASTNEYVAAIGFNDNSGLDRRIAYDLKSTFCTSIPLVKSALEHTTRYSNNGSINLSVVNPSYLNNTYSYLWEDGSTQAVRNNLAKGTYTITLSSSSGANRVIQKTLEDKMTFVPATTTNSVVKIIENTVTVDPALPQPSGYNIVDYRSHAYDPNMKINVQKGGGSVRFRVAGSHPYYPNQINNTDKFNHIFYVELQEAVQPLPAMTSLFDMPFKMLFGYRDNGRVAVMNGHHDDNHVDPSNIIPDIHFHQYNIEVELRFVGNKVLEIYMDDQLVRTETLVENIEEYYFMVGFNERDVWQRRIFYDLRTSFDGIPPIVYAELKEELDGGYYQLTDDHLRFKFTQEYAVNTGGESIAYKIYKWDRTSNAGTFVSTYGTNWVDIDLSNYNLANDSYYTIEFEGNKEQKYILRFKTKSN